MSASFGNFAVDDRYGNSVRVSILELVRYLYILLYIELRMKQFFGNNVVGRKVALFIVCIMTMMMSNTSAFVSHGTRGGGGLCGTASSQFIGRKMQIDGMPKRNSNPRKKTTELKMLLGSDAGLFGVGAPEIVSKEFYILCLKKFIAFFLLFNLI